MNLSPHSTWLTLLMVLTDRQLIEVKNRSRRHTDLVTSQAISEAAVRSIVASHSRQLLPAQSLAYLLRGSVPDII